MAKKIAYCISFLLLVVSATTHAQKSWSLEECIAHALTNNIQLQQQQLSINEGDNALLQSKLNLLPAVSGNTSYSSNWGTSQDNNFFQLIKDQRASNGRVSLDASVVLFSGLQKQNAIKKNQLDLQATIHDVEKLKDDISLNVTAAYLQILLSKASHQIAKTQLETTKQQLEKTKKLVDAGSATLASFLELQAQEATEEVQLINAENDIATSYITLKKLLDLLQDKDFEIATPILKDMDATSSVSIDDVDVIFEKYSDLRPEIKAVEYRMLSAEKSLSIAKGALYPTLRLGTGINTMFSEPRNRNIFDHYDPATGDPVFKQEPYPIFDQMKEQYSYGISLSLSIPIFSGLQARIGVKNAKLNVRRNELQIREVKNTLYKEIQKAETDAIAAFKRHDASQKSVTSLTESFRYVEQRFNVGAATTTDYIVAKNNLIKAESELIRAKYQYIFQTKILDFYKDIPLTL